MTTAELKTFTEQLLDGVTLDPTLFYNLANTAKDIRESKRAWMKLRAEDSSKTVTSANTYTTMKDLPEDFLRTYSPKRRDGQRSAVVLKNGNSLKYVQEIGFDRRVEYSDVNGHFYIDHANDQFAFTGSYDKTYTVYLNYIKKSTAFSESNTTGWDFPSQFHPLLAFDIAVLHKGGIDYDAIAERMAQFHGITIQALEQSMNLWDANLQKSALGI